MDDIYSMCNGHEVLPLALYFCARLVLTGSWSSSCGRCCCCRRQESQCKCRVGTLRFHKKFDKLLVGSFPHKLESFTNPLLFHAKSLTTRQQSFRSMDLMYSHHSHIVVAHGYPISG